MSKALSFWAAHGTLHGLLGEAGESVYLWTLTGATDAIRQDVKKLHAAWDALKKSEGWRALNLRGIRRTERGTKGERCLHIHFVITERVKVRRMLELARRVGFGRVNVKEVPRHRVGYVAKYLTKPGEGGFRRWATFGEVKRVRCEDVTIYDAFKRAAVETRTTFPGVSEGAAEWWWSRCLRGLAAVFLRVPYDKLAPLPVTPEDFISAARLGVPHEEWCRDAMGWTFEPWKQILEAFPGRRLRTMTGIYRGRWVPEFRVTYADGREIVNRQARHLVEIKGVPWWIREPATPSIEIPARPGDLVVIGFFGDQFDPEEKAAGEAVGAVRVMLRWGAGGGSPPALADCGSSGDPSRPDYDPEAPIQAICAQWAVNAKRMALAGLPCDESGSE